MWLVRNGIPYDVALTLPDAEVLGHCVIFGEFEGGEFSWSEMQWRRKE